MLEVVPHSHVADIEDKTADSLSLREVAPTLKNVVCHDVKGCWTINLLERSREEAKVIVFPFEQARDLINELGVRDVRTSLIHCSLVATLWCWTTEVIPKSTSHVTGLVDMLASDYVQDECITWDFLVLFDLDDISCLNTCPVE